MSRIYKTKRGFTLVEMVLVIAIIVILAAVVGMSIYGFVSKSNDASSSLASDRVKFRSNNAASNSAFVEAGF